MLPSEFPDREVCIVGLGYVGLTLAVAMADSGFRVHGLEVREDVLGLLRDHKPHFWEPGLVDRLTRVARNGNFTFSRDLPAANAASVYIITVGTPLGGDGNASLSSVQNAVRQIAAALRHRDLVILRSTVKLGTARNVVKPLLDETRKRLELAVCPERTLEGRALVELFELPQIIGADDAGTRARCAQLFGVLTPTTIRLSSLEAAELVKLVDNTYRDVTFGFANEIARLCANAGVSAREVIRACNLGYPRTNLAWPGPVGGPCLEKDPHILAESAAAYGVEMELTRAARRTNEQQPDEAAERLKRLAAVISEFPAEPKIVLAGLAFKGIPATDDLRGTMAKPIAEALRRHFPGAQLVGYDAVVTRQGAEKHFGFPVADSLEAAASGADMLVIANNHPVFQRVDLGAIAARMNSPSIIYDFWNMHDGNTLNLPLGALYVSLGNERGPRSLA